MTMKTCMAAAAALLAGTVAATAAPFTNGSFETATVNPGSGFVTLGGGSTEITGWTILGGATAIDYIGGYWVAQDGERSLDLNGLETGGIAQTFDVKPNTPYKISFYMSGNPDQRLNQPLRVSVDGVDVDQDPATFTWPGIVTSQTRENMGWVEMVYSFTTGATTSSVTLTFQSLTQGFFGPAIDNVSVAVVPLPFALPMFLAGLGAIGVISRRRKDAATA